MQVPVMETSLFSVVIRDDAFTESVPRTNSAASGPQHDDRASSRNDHQSCEHTPEHRYGPAVGRWDYLKAVQDATLILYIGHEVISCHRLHEDRGFIVTHSL